MGKDFQLTLYGERGEEFKEVLGSNKVCVETPFLSKCRLDGAGEQVCYFLDLRELSTKQYDRLVRHLAEKFGASGDEVREGLAEYGLPIIAEDCMLVVENPHLYFD